MHKKLLPLSIATVLTAGPVMLAQAEVKLYGAAQVEVAHIKNDGVAAYPTTPGSSLNNNAVPAGAEETVVVDNKRGRIGIVADEDLGGGLQGLAKFEYNVDTADNVDGATSPFSARDSWVGLKGGFGLLRLGRSGGPYKQSGVALDPFVTTTLEARNNFGMSGNQDGFGILNAHNSFVSDGVFYTSPSLASLTLDVYVGLDGTGATVATPGNQAAQTNGDLSAVLAWKSGPANAFVAYNKAANVTTGAATATKLGGQFNIAKKHTVSAQIEQTDNDTGPGGEGQYIFIGYQIELGKITGAAQVGKFENDTNTEASYLALGGIYNFSNTFRTFAGVRVTESETAGTTVRDEAVLSLGMRKDF